MDLAKANFWGATPKIGLCQVDNLVFANTHPKEPPSNEFMQPPTLPLHVWCLLRQKQAQNRRVLLFRSLVHANLGM